MASLPHNQPLPLNLDSPNYLLLTLSTVSTVQAALMVFLDRTSSLLGSKPYNRPHLIIVLVTRISSGFGILKCQTLHICVLASNASYVLHEFCIHVQIFYVSLSFSLTFSNFSTYLRVIRDSRVCKFHSGANVFYRFLLFCIGFHTFHKNVSLPYARLECAF